MSGPRQTDTQSSQDLVWTAGNDVLDHHISLQGMVPLPSKVQAVAEFPSLVPVKALQEVLGMVTFYIQFLHRAAYLLYRALQLKKANNWTPKLVLAFAPWLMLPSLPIPHPQQS